VNKSLLAGVFIALAAPTATMAAPTATVPAAFITDDAMREIAAKKVRVKPKSAPEKPDDPSYLKGTNIPTRITAPPPGFSILVPSSPDGNRVVLATWHRPSDHARLIEGLRVMSPDGTSATCGDA
jgi:hypothetical protein